LKLQMILTLMIMMTCPMSHLTCIKIYFVSKCLLDFVPQIFE
jgi:hypothetical protein